MADQNPIVKCGSCGGTYRRKNPDGTQYFHACPPLNAAELKAALESKTITLAPEQQSQLDQAAKIDQEAPAKAGEASATDRALASLVVERPNKRDENITGAGANGQPAPMKSPGAGVSAV